MLVCFPMSDNGKNETLQDVEEADRFCCLKIYRNDFQTYALVPQSKIMGTGLGGLGFGYCCVNDCD